MHYKLVPAELQAIDQWVVWKSENGTKMPKVGAGKCSRNASSTNEKTWRSFKQCCKLVEKGLADGIGFVFTDDDQYIAIDLDNKQGDPVLDVSHRDMINQFKSYAERSPSGTGYHIILKGEAFKSFNQSPYEAYWSGRYMTFTGDVVDDHTHIVENNKQLKRFIDEFGKPEREKFQPVAAEDLVEGSRNDTIFRHACTLHYHGVPADTIAITLTGFNRGLPNPLPEKEVHALLKSAISYDRDFDMYSWLTENMVWVKDQGAFWDSSSSIIISSLSLDMSYYKDMPQDEDGKRVPPVKFLRASERLQVVDSIGWHPEKEFTYENDNGSICLNTYQPSTLEARAGDPSPWLDHVAWLIPDEAVRNDVLDWMAHTVQRPGTKINYSLFIGGPERVGKDLMFLPLKEAIGWNNCDEINAPELDSEFNQFLFQTKLLTIGEMFTDVRSARKIENKLKQILASPPKELGINIKGQKRFNVPNIVSVIFMSNHRDALNITGGNAARYLCWWCDVTKKPDSYYDNLAPWLHNNAGIVLNYLQHRDISEFNSSGNARPTEFSREIVCDSRGGLESDIEERIADRVPPFHVDLVTAMEATEGLTLPPTLRQTVIKTLRRLGCLSLQGQRWKKTPVRVWAVRDQGKYRGMSASDLYDTYQDQGQRKDKLRGIQGGRKV